MAESKSNKSYWILLVVIVLVIGTVVAKQATKREAPRSPVVVASPAPAGQPIKQVASAAAMPPAAAAKPAARAAAPIAKPAVKPTPPPAPAAVPPAPAVEQTAEQIELIPGSKLAECLKSGWPTVADFGAGWCKPCKMMDPVLKEVAKKYEGKLNVVFVSIDDYPNLARDYRIGPIPTQVFLNGKGKEVGRHIGYYPLAEFEAQMKQFGVIE